MSAQGRRQSWFPADVTHEMNIRTDSGAYATRGAIMAVANTKCVLILIILTIPFASVAQDWKLQPVALTTRWAADIDPKTPWPEYPRPQMVRSNWLNLNGLWEYQITARDALPPEEYAGLILVPYPLESALSGVKRTLEPDQLLWYRRTIDFQAAPVGERVLLHFGAVDYEATVYVNGKKLKTHSGGYQAFTIEITDAVKPGKNDLVVAVYDPTERGPNPHGKQNLHAQWMYYSPSSGIWQTVWIERVPPSYIEALRLTPDVDRSELRVEVGIKGNSKGHSVEVTIRSGGALVRQQTIQGATAVPINQLHLWSPDDPHLYDLQVRLLRHGQMVDVVNSYFGMRKIHLKADAQGRTRIHLNNRYTFNLGVVDQGYWPDGLYTAPSDAALKFDIQAVKAFGFNTVRKHIKIEPQRWYYYCDRLGLLVWQDMPSSNNDTAEGRAQFERELKENLTQLHNHPSITTWVLFNEGWGAYDQDRLAHWIMQADPSRLLNGHSGPYDHVMVAQWMKTMNIRTLFSGDMSSIFDDFQRLQYQAPANWMVGNILDLHFYPGPKMFPMQPDVASVTGEHGSFGVYVEGHVWNERKQVGKGLGGSNMSSKQMLTAYAKSIEQLKELETRGLSGSAYFQLFDVESEHQGLLTYDRAMSKVPIRELERLNAKLVPRADNYSSAAARVSVESADIPPESQRYQTRLAEFQNGRRDSLFLQRLTLMALRQNDEAMATKIGNALVEREPQPYGKRSWETIVAITHSSKDRGFELLRTRTEEANTILGPQAAQKKILEIIRRELIVPFLTEKPRTQTWQEFEKLVTTEHGELGREAVYGAQMMESLLQEDWNGFGKAYSQYFQTATQRCPYRVHSLAFQVLSHVSDPRALDTAIRVMQWQIDSPRESPVFGRYDPTELDTYANLLFKVGRITEAIEWQRKAVILGDQRDRQIIENLHKMTSECMRNSCMPPSRINDLTPSGLQ